MDRTTPLPFFPVPLWVLVLAVKAKPLRGALRAALTAPGERKRRPPPALSPPPIVDSALQAPGLTALPPSAPVRSAR